RAVPRTAAKRKTSLNLCESASAFSLRAAADGPSLNRRPCLQRSPTMLFRSLLGRWVSGSSRITPAPNRRRPRRYCPVLQALEERLPPGDAVLGSLLAYGWGAADARAFALPAASLDRPDGLAPADRALALPADFAVAAPPGS